MPTKEEYERAKEIVEEYETGKLSEPVLITHVPSEAEIEKAAKESGRIEGKASAVAWWHYQKGAKWMRDKLLNRDTEDR